MPRRLRLRSHSQSFTIILIVGIEVAAGLLDGHHLIYDLVRRSAQFRAIARLQYKSNCLGPLVSVGVGIYRAALCRAALAHETPEVIHAAIGFEQIVHCRNAPGRIDLAALPPKTAGDCDSTYRDIS